MAIKTRSCWIIPVALVGIGVPAVAAEYLTTVTSEIYQTTGTPKEIATRANICISQNLAPGTTDSQLVITSDLDGGIIVARSAISYPDGLSISKVRSTFTFEAREGRFRIVQTNLERLSESIGTLYRGQGWVGIGKWTGSGWKKADEAFASSATAVAKCVMSGSVKRDDW